MNNIRSFGTVDVSLETIDANNFAYLVTFPIAMGNVPTMIAHTTELTPAGAASVAVSVKSEGNVVGGSFTLSFSGETTYALPSQATAGQVATALESLTSIGSVSVQRSAIDSQLGYRWTITFTSPMNAGNVPSLIPDYGGLTVSNPLGTVIMNVTSYDGNEIGGTFTLGFQRSSLSATTASIAYDASAADMKAALEAMSGGIIPAGSISVSRIGPDGQRGYTWLVSFLSDYSRSFYGPQSLFTFNGGSLTGSSAVGSVSKVRTGTTQEVQSIKVTKSTGVINQAHTFALDFNGQKNWYD